MQAIYLAADTGCKVINLTVTVGASVDFSATPIVQIEINPNFWDSAGIFVGLKDIRDAQGNAVTDAKLAGYQIEVSYDHGIRCS